MELHLDAEVSRYLGGVRTPSVTAAYLETNLRHWDDHGYGLWTLRTDDGKFVGRAGLRQVDLEGVPELEIAYALARDAWGHGYATEITQALIAFWKAHCLEPSLVGIVVKGHGASEAVLLKTDFRYERDANFHGARCGVFRLQR